MNKSHRKLITLILFVAAALCFVLRFCVGDEELDKILMIVGGALIAAAVIARLSKSTFGHKPTLKEIEEKQFGKTE